METSIESLEELAPSLANQVVAEINQIRDEEAVKATVEQAEIAREAGEQKAMDELGRVRFNIHPTIYHRFGQQFGYECWNDKEFLRDFERDFPEARVKCGGTKIQVGYTGSAKPRFRKVYREDD